MRLNKGQRETLLQWLAEGCDTGEINKRAASHKPPFKVTRQQAQYYRAKYEVDIRKRVEEGASEALERGYALREMRVQQLNDLADEIHEYLQKNGLTIAVPKVIGQGKNAEVIYYDFFNKAAIESFRGLLDDIAAEMGQRVKNIDVTSKGEQIQVVAYIPDNGREDRT